MSHTKRKRILIVDDLPKVRAALKSYLELNEGFSVIGEAISGSDAVLKTQSLQPDIVIMDILMQDMDGLEATSMIKRMTPTPKVIILTILTDPQIRRSAYEAGADAYIEKNAGIDGLIQTINN